MLYLVASRNAGSFNMLKFSNLIGFTLLLLSSAVNSESYAHHSIQLPVVGWAGYDTSMGFINSESWGMSDNFQLGLGYQGAIDKPLWWSTETVLGVGSYKLSNVQVSIGLLYFFANGDFQPFCGLDIQYLQIFEDASFWAGLKPVVGVELFLIEDFSLQFKVGYNLYLNLQNPLRQGLEARVALSVYL